MLEKFQLFKNLSPNLLEEVENACDRKTYSHGELIIQEGDPSTDIYLIVSGQVDLYKIDANSQKNLKFKQLAAGQQLGELSFVDGSVRSCSAWTVGSVETYILSKEKLIAHAPNYINILSTIKEKTRIEVSNQLRSLSAQHVTMLQERIHAMEERNFFGAIFISMAGFACITIIANQTIHELFPLYNAYSLSYVWTFIIIGAIPGLWLAKKYKIPISTFGVTKRLLKKSIVEGIGFSLLGLLILLGAAWTADFFNPSLQLLTTFLSLSTRDILTSEAFWSYLPHCYVQELVARGIVQTSIQRFLGDRRGIRSVLITSFFFGTFHSIYGLSAIAFTFFAGIIFGLFYLRTRNLAGVSIVHYILGYLPAATHTLSIS